MDDVLLEITAFIFQMFLYIIYAARRPWEYVFSSKYREQLKSEWSYRPRVLFYGYVFGGLILLILSVCIITYIIYFFAFRPKPDPTAVEIFKNELKDKLFDAVKEARDNGRL